MFLLTPSVIEVAAGDAVQTVKLPRLTFSDDIRWTHITARTTDGTARRIIIYIEVGAGWSLLTVKTPSLAYDSVHVPGVVHLPANARICADFYNVDAGESLELHAYGYKVS